MIASFLKCKIELFEYQQDTSNNNKYNFYKKINAQLKYQKGDQIIQSHQIFNSKSLTFRLRKRNDINDNMLIRFKNEIFDIINIQNVGGYNGDILIMCVLTNKIIEENND